MTSDELKNIIKLLCKIIGQRKLISFYYESNKVKERNGELSDLI